MNRYILTPDIFDKIDETEAGIGGEIQLTDALQKLDSIYGITFEGKTYDIEQTGMGQDINPIVIADDEFKNDLIGYMESYI